MLLHWFVGLHLLIRYGRSTIVCVCFHTGLLESNPFMECFGRIGFIHPEWFQVRKVIFLVAMLMSTIGWSCILLTDLSISKDFKVLQHFHFSKGDVKYGFVESENGNLSGLVEGSTRLYVGLSAVAWEQTVINVTFEDIDAIVNANPGITEEEFRRDFVDQFKTKNQFVTGFDEFCDGDSRVWFVEEDQCDKCEEASTKMIRRYVRVCCCCWKTIMCIGVTPVLLFVLILIVAPMQIVSSWRLSFTFLPSRTIGFASG